MDSIAAAQRTRDYVAAALGGTEAAYEQADLVLEAIEQSKKKPARTLAERFWPKVNKTKTCWLWTGATEVNGYGTYKYAGRQLLAHRIAYELAHGQKPDMQLDHLCRVRLCVNPNHLEQVTSRTNTLRGNSPSARNAIKTHCHRGHEFTPENTYIYRGHRYCRACSRINQREHRGKTNALAVCTNCYTTIRSDLKSTTGFLHSQTNTIRCDGRPSRQRNFRTTEVAVPHGA